MSTSEQKKESPWTLEEQIAFECALAADEREDWRTLRARDAALALPEELWQPPRRRAVARRWLEERLRREPSIALAAGSIGQSIGVAGQLFSAVACLAGVGLATAALAYTGQDPINVSAFFSVFVLLQAVLACLLLGLFILPRALNERMAFGPLFRVARMAFEFLFSKTQALANRFLSGHQREGVAEIAATARRGLALHGAVIKWLVFVKIQSAALFFNVGALIALLVAVVFSDRAFGWQTTLEVSSESIQTIVNVFASPWAWLWGEGVGYPNLAQIEGSRIRLKEGIQSLDTQDLAAWWRFLALGIVVYGVLPRALFFALGRWQARAALQRYDFRNAAAERLLGRLAPAADRFTAEPVEGPGGQSASAGAVSRPPPVDSSQKIVCYVTEEMGEVFDLEALREKLALRWNVPGDNVALKTGLPDSGAREAGDGDTQHALVFESWMPPIKETERQLKELRARVEPRSLIKIVLLGVPGVNGDEISLHPATQYADIWDAFARRQGDPYLILDNYA